MGCGHNTHLTRVWGRGQFEVGECGLFFIVSLTKTHISSETNLQAPLREAELGSRWCHHLVGAGPSWVTAWARMLSFSLTAHGHNAFPSTKPVSLESDLKETTQNSLLKWLVKHIDPPMGQASEAVRKSSGGLRSVASTKNPGTVDNSMKNQDGIALPNKTVSEEPGYY